jgi:uncharacterized RDD family membrane protein YckC
MQTVRIQTTQNINIDYEVAGLGERMVAYLIDAGGFIILLIAFAYIFADMHIKKWGLGIEIIIWMGLYVLYDLVAEVFFNGQSAGKKVMKIRVISIDGARPGIGQYFARWLFRIIDTGLTLGMCSIISIAVTENKQRVGDIVAGTTIIKTNVSSDSPGLNFEPVEAGYRPVFFEVSQLSDIQIALISEVLNNFLKTANESVLSKMADKVRSYLSLDESSVMGDYQLLLTVIKDYNSLHTFSTLHN